MLKFKVYPIKPSTITTITITGNIKTIVVVMFISVSPIFRRLCVMTQSVDFVMLCE